MGSKCLRFNMEQLNQHSHELITSFDKLLVTDY